ncbi:MAG TPA: hypothetical protein VFZ51_06915, partial [Woeseiaceae bacterium]
MSRTFTVAAILLAAWFTFAGHEVPVRATADATGTLPAEAGDAPLVSWPEPVMLLVLGSLLAAGSILAR